MRKICLGVLLIFLSLNSFAMSSDEENLRKKLESYKVSKFSFNEASISTVTYLIQHQTGVNFVFDPKVDQDKTTVIRLKDANFLQFLNVGTHKLGMTYQIISSNQIKIMPKTTHITSQ